jgi:hypothetical protein
MSVPYKNCRRCDRPVVVHAEQYDTFEGMHWLCFHLEFEHDTDPDMACADPGCPWSELKIYRDKLNELGVPADKVMEAAIQGLPFPPSAGA